MCCNILLVSYLTGLKFESFNMPMWLKDKSKGRGAAEQALLKLFYHSLCSKINNFKNPLSPNPEQPPSP